MSKRSGIALAEGLTTGNGEWMQCMGRPCAWSVSGEFDGATASLEVRDRRSPAEVWVPEGASFTASGSKTVLLTDMHEIRLATTGGGGGQSLSSYFTPIGG